MSGLTVVVCAWTTERIGLLDLALGSVRSQPEVDRVVLVVDHNPELLAYARLAWTDVDVLPSSGPRGLSGARASGLAVVDTPLVAFLDDDAAAEEGWAGAMVGALTDPQVHAVGGTVRASWADGRPRWFPATFDWVVGCTHEGVRVTAGPVRNVIGSSMAFRTASLRAVGGFDDGLGRRGDDAAGAEETATCIRLRQAHGPGAVWFDPRCTVAHHVPAERQRLAYFVRRCWAEGRSKARMVSALGPQADLSAERSHLARALPRAVARGLLTPRGLRDGGVAKALTSLLGVAAAGLSFLLTRPGRPAATAPAARAGAGAGARDEVAA